MNKKNVTTQLLVASGELAKKVLDIGLDRYLQSIEHTTILPKYAGSIEMRDDEFSGMLEALEDDK